jgi:hypothetical protein
VDIEEQKRIVREQRAGYAVLRKLEIERMRTARIADRLDAFTAIMEFAEHMGWTDDDRKDDEIAQLQRRKAFERHAATNR